MAQLQIKRVREDRDPDDGARILVDKLWPRGVSKDHAALNHWFKNLAPTDGLRKWFGHDPQKFEEFASRYRKELDQDASGEVAELEHVLRDVDAATLLYDAKDVEHNNAVVLLGWLRDHRSGF
ncbi:MULTISPECIES: DUF488 domain-containing protein [Kocuria]|uniref:DUF488 domain-containing protein n=1 Tax=Kocuria gwangalliensis TaxID=501592 RepID=A0ABP8WS13_9MICC|nr:DUF488 family protein [Kocuria sp.]MDO5368494.1 DUF488 family protein [Kocuria sp.]